MPTQPDPILSVRIPRSLMKRFEAALTIEFMSNRSWRLRRGAKTDATIQALRDWCSKIEAEK